MGDVYLYGHLNYIIIARQNVLFAAKNRKHTVVGDTLSFPELKLCASCIYMLSSFDFNEDTICHTYRLQSFDDSFSFLFCLNRGI